VTTPPFVVGRPETGQALAAVLRARLGLSWSRARQLVEKRQVRINGQMCADPARRLKTGQHVEVMQTVSSGGRGVQNPRQVGKTGERPGQSGRGSPIGRVVQSPRLRGKITERPGHPPAIPSGIVVRHADHVVVVVDKPAGLTTMRHADEAAEFGARGKLYLPKTLADYLSRLLPGGGRLRAVHRIDRDTSGLVVFARTSEAERHLGRQFRAHTVGRRYLAIARGRPPEGRIESWLVRDRGDGRRGSGAKGQGQRAVTHVREIEPLGPCSLVECRLETGRTHQVRIHLGEAGAPLAGETVYDRPIHGQRLPDQSGAPRLALHAASLAFEHPETAVRMEWESPLPDDLQAAVRRLRVRMTEEE
jgi:23S rRNA pseudouridine1911/1915/1917 synthase